MGMKVHAIHNERLSPGAFDPSPATATCAEAMTLMGPTGGADSMWANIHCHSHRFLRLDRRPPCLQTDEGNHRPPAREAQECFIIHGYIGSDALDGERRAAFDELRHIGAGLVARYLTAARWWHYPVRPICRSLGWDIHRAGAELISLGNSILLNETKSMEDFQKTIDLIRQHLDLPTPRVPLLMREP
jgi:hypothetical protein